MGLHPKQLYLLNVYETVNGNDMKTNDMKTGYILFLMLFAATISVAQETVTGTITHDNIARNYRLTIPSAYDGSSDLPLVFNFHGYGSNAAQQQFYSAMDVIADTANFFVCYPNGIGTAWNVGWDFGSTADDVGFVSSLIDHLAENYSINTERVYACGMSNGGFMSYRLACELNDRIAAVASVTGSIVPDFLSSCNPGEPVPALSIHGTADDVVPYEGQVNLSTDVDSVAAFWASNNGCDPVPTVEQLPDIDTEDASTVTRISYNDCDNEEISLLFRINGGGHTWPGAFISFPGSVTNQDINASHEIWTFFNRYTLSGLSNTENLTAAPRVQIYPNPTSAQLFINEVKGNAQIQVYTSYGHLLHEGRFVHQTLINTSQWPSGIYIVVIQDQAGRYSQKIVKR
jgi:polyhydroxybutyrate depolymerase